MYKYTNTQDFNRFKQNQINKYINIFELERITPK